MAVALPPGGGPSRDPGEMLRWGLSFAAILALHAGIVMYALARHQAVPAEAEAAPILVDLSPLATPEAEAMNEATPGPEATEASAPEAAPETEMQETAEAEETPPPVVEDLAVETPPDVPPAESLLPPTPKVVQKAEVALPPPPKAQKVVEPKVEPKPQVRPKPVQKPVPKPKPEVKRAVKPPSVAKVESKAPPAQRASAQTSAPSGRRGPQSAASSATGGRASAADMSSWHSRLVAHIQRHKRYPAGVRDSGTAVVAFVMDSNGRLLSRRLAGSSGSSVLDRETLDLLARAQPLPKPPPGAAQSVFQFAIPIRYSVR